MVKEILQPQLATYSLPPWFMLNANKDAVVFSADWDGATTPNSDNPRSELREMVNNGNSLANWDGGSGRHQMDVDIRVTRLEGGNDVVLAQIHGGDDDVSVFRLFSNGQLWITNGDNPNGKQIASGYVPGPTAPRMKLGFDVLAGKIRYKYNGNVVPYELPIGSGNYFKTGCYLQVQNNSGGATTELYSVRVVHS